MAIGDAAGAAGLEVVPQSQDLRFGYARINQKGDELAAEMAARVSGDGLKVDKTTILISTSTPANIPGASGRIWLKPV